MKSFLSHSSKDKAFVRQVAKYLGEALCEYDEYTFEYVLNAEAIRRALARADLFVLFLSENSVKSSFVDEEIRTALDFRGAGRIKKVMVIALDQTSYQVLPEWMRAINIVTKLSNPLTVGRKLEAELLALDAENERSNSIYIPREREETSLRQALRKPAGEAPVSIHSVGYVGIGRKTFLRKCLTELFPRQIRTFVLIRLAKFEGPDEFYRRLYDYFRFSSIEEKIRDFGIFRDAAESEKTEILADLIAETIENDELLVIDDEGGVYTDEGDYQPYLNNLISELRGAPRPVIGFVQTRMMPQRFREEKGYSFHTFLTPFDDEKISELVSFNLKAAGIDYTSQDLTELSALLDGSPVNVKLAVASVKSYGIDVFLADPQLLIEWKRRRAEDFLNKIDFSAIEQEIMALLIDYRYVPFSILRNSIKTGVEIMAASLRKLEEYCCIERRDRLYVISSPIHDACSRDKRFKRGDSRKMEVASLIVGSLDEYKDDENVPISLMELAVKASIKAAKPQRYVAQLILPSYYVYLAREAYQEDKRGQAIDFCKKAFEYRNSMTSEARIEVLRIWGLSAVRIGEQEEIDTALKGLAELNGKRAARQHSFFIKGFSFRFKREYDKAEAEFLRAHDLAPRSYNINRELASLYRHQKDFVEAEGYARAAYDVAPTNPFVLDILLECLLGKSHLGMSVDQREIEQLFVNLERYGDVPGSSFFQARKAQDYLRAKNKPEALKAVNKAIERTPDHIPCYFLRGEILLNMRDAPAARKDLVKINQLLEKRGGFSEEDEGKVVELEVGVLSEEQNYRAAREKLNNSQFVPQRTAKRLAKKLAIAISYEPEKADAKSKDWAKRILN